MNKLKKQQNLFFKNKVSTDLSNYENVLKELELDNLQFKNLIDQLRKNEFEVAHILEIGYARKYPCKSINPYTQLIKTIKENNKNGEE